MQYNTIKGIIATDNVCIYGMINVFDSYRGIDGRYPYWLAYHPGHKFIQTKRATLAVKIAKLLGCAEVHSEHRKGSI